MNRTLLCELGHHGTSERRSVGDPPDFSKQFSGQCAGYTFSPTTREETPCDCACHKPDGRAYEVEFCGRPHNAQGISWLQAATVTAPDEARALEMVYETHDHVTTAVFRSGGRTTNRKGLTFSEWLEAAGSDRPRFAQTSWALGEYPTDYRAKGGDA